MIAGDEKRRTERCVTCTRKAANGFCHLPEGALRIMGTQGMLLSLRDRMPLYLEGAPVQSVYVICSGRLKLYSNSVGGRTVITRIAGAGELLGVSELIGEDAGKGVACFETSAEAMEAVQVMALPVAAFRQMLREHPEAGARMGQQLARQCRDAYTRIRLLGQGRSVAERVAGYLLEVEDDQRTSPEHSFEIRMTHEELAQELGLSRESVCRALSVFRRSGAVRIHGCRWTIIDRAALEDACRTTSDRLI